MPIKFSLTPIPNPSPVNGGREHNGSVHGGGVRHYGPTAFLLVLLIFLIVGCDTLAVPTITPTRELTAPTLAPTDNAIPRPPTEVPSSFIDPSGASGPTAAALPNDLDLPPLPVGDTDGSGRQVVQITTHADEIMIGELYDNVPVRGPGVLLIGEQRSNWGAFPQTLEENGYTVLVIETPTTLLSDEFREVMGSFVDIGQGDNARLDPGRIAVIGEGVGGTSALAGCAADTRCDLLGLLSPVGVDGMLSYMGAYGTRPLLVSASRSDSGIYSLAETLAAAGMGDVLFQPFDDAGQGAAMLVNRTDFPGFVLTWLARYLRS